MRSTTLTQTADTARIEKLFADFMAAWTANDAEAFGALFTDDSDYVSYDGTIARGRRCTSTTTTSSSGASWPARPWSATWSRSATSRRTSPSRTARPPS